MVNSIDRHISADVAPAIVVKAMPWIDPARKTSFVVGPNTSVAEIVAAALPGIASLDHVRVTIGDLVVPRDYWASVRPRPGTSVVVRVLPGSGNLLRSVLTLTVAVAALALGQFYAAPLAASALGSMLGLTVSTSSALIAGGVLLVGTLLINAFIPARKKSADAKESPAYSIQGWRNPINPDGAIPVVMGRHRFAPPHAAYPFTECIIDDQYVTALFCIGHGPVEISNIRIGETAIEKYTNVTVQTQNGVIGDTQQTLYTQQTIEEQVSVELSYARANTFGPDSRFTAADATEFSIDIQFPGGLAGFVDINKKSVRVPFVVPFVLSIREESSATWIDYLDVQVLHATTRPFTRTFRKTLPTRGRYEVKLVRASIDWDDLDQSYLPAQITSRAFWTVIRSYRPEHPLNVNFPLALIAVKVRATGQLNGTLENLSADVARICLDWDYLSQTWIERATNNPASLFRYVLQGRPFAYRRADAQIDFEALADFHDFCRIKGLTYNRIHDAPTSVFEALLDVAAAGRATPHHDGEKWTVIIDRPREIVTAHISPRNSWGFSGERSYVRFPDAFRVKFKDATSKFGYEDAERLIPWPGFVGDPEITEELELPGVTDPAQVWLHGRRRQYELMLRRDEYSAMQDFEAITVQRGDRVALSHDVLDRVQLSARVRSVQAGQKLAEDHYDGGSVALDEIVTMQAGKDYAVRFRRDTGESLLRLIATVPGESNGVFLVGTGALPAAGDLALFGEAGKETVDALVKTIEGGDLLTRRIVLVDHAPEIDALLDAEIVPPWNGRVGDEIDVGSHAPGVPHFGTVVSGVRAGGSQPSSIYVQIIAGSGEQTATFDLDHRLEGAATWSRVSFLAAAGSVYLDTYAIGDAVELRARGLNAATPPDASAWTATTKVYVGSQDARKLDFSKRFNVSALGMGW